MATEPIHFVEWAKQNAARLAPPVCNAMVYGQGDWLVMAVGGPNAREDFHINEGEEFFYQLKGDMVLEILEQGKRKNVPIREGEVFLLPARVPHSPQRGPGTIGLVAERKRKAEELDGLRFYGKADSDHEAQVLYEQWWHCQDLGKELKPIIEDYFASDAKAKGVPVPGKVLDKPPVATDDKVVVPAPKPLADKLAAVCAAADGSRAEVFRGAEFQVRAVTSRCCGGERVSRAGEVLIMQAAGAARVVTGDAAVAMREGTLSTVPPATEYAILPDGDEAITWEFFME